MKIYDVSAMISREIPVYEGDPAVSITETAQIDKGAACNVSMLAFGSHTGTHIDVPYHFVADGKTIDQLPPDYFMGKAKVFDLTGRKAVTAEDLKGLDIREGDIVIFRTDNSVERRMEQSAFYREFVYVSDDGAAYLAEKKVKGVGVDYLSVEQFASKTPATHRTLLGHEILIVEGLVLTDIAPGEYTLLALPLRIKGGNGSPVRAVLIQE
ncbi:MAG: cyclase family protein [Oscillospiraceae bacterium]|nr:cyclase family protein [Oscillospiraceae bacterium]